MQTVAYDPFIASEAASKLGVELMDLKSLLGRSDFVTVHTPMTSETKHLIGRDELQMARPGLRMINCARGGIIDETALYDALCDGTVAGAALDVFEQEPPPPDHP